MFQATNTGMETGWRKHRKLEYMSRMDAEEIKEAVTYVLKFRHKHEISTNCNRLSFFCVWNASSEEGKGSGSLSLVSTDL
jgi:hypothetical protein